MDVVIEAKCKRLKHKLKPIKRTPFDDDRHSMHSALNYEYIHVIPSYQFLDCLKRILTLKILLLYS